MSHRVLCTKYITKDTFSPVTLYHQPLRHSGMTRILGRRLTEASSRDRAMFSLLEVDSNPSCQFIPLTLSLHHNIAPASALRPTLGSDFSFSKLKTNSFFSLSMTIPIIKTSFARVFLKIRIVHTHYDSWTAMTKQKISPLK